MALTPEDVGRLGALARIELTEEEKERYAPELALVLNAAASIRDVVSDDIEPMTHAVKLTNVFRDDVVEPSLTLDQVFDMAPDTEDDRFRVPQILGEE